MPILPAVTDARRMRIHALWDALADLDVTGADAALDLLLSSLCDLVDAQNANWIGAVRLPAAAPGDPVHGWRPRLVHYLHPQRPTTELAEKLTRLLEAGAMDITTVRNVAQAGHFRSNRLTDLVPADWFASDYYRMCYRDLGRSDAIWSGVPINGSAEVYIGLFRDLQHPPFTAAERDAVAGALRGLKWFLRQTLLARGLLAARAPLTAVEGKVLQGLLGGRTEKKIAEALKQSPNTTHTHVTSIYRKFGVRNRAALMAVWLGKPV